MKKSSLLPSDAASIRKLAARSMFDLFSSMSEGMMLVDRTGRVVWINDSYKRFLESRLREHFKLTGTPIRIEMRSAENPFDKKES